MYDTADIVQAIQRVERQVSSLTTNMIWLAIFAGAAVSCSGPPTDATSHVESCRSDAMAFSMDAIAFTPRCMSGKGYDYRWEDSTCAAPIRNLDGDCYERRSSWRTGRNWAVSKWINLSARFK